MCLILVAWRVHPDAPLLVAANRDEFHARPAAQAAFWSDRPQILAGRDLEARGTWLGVSRSGRFAAVTNYRGGREPGAAQSRGLLVADFLDSNAKPAAYAADIAARGRAFSGYNLLASDGDELWWHSNRARETDRAPRCLEAGVHALGNLLLDSSEVEEHRKRFAQAIDERASFEALFTLLGAARIVAPEYGTRCATVLSAGPAGGIRFAERSFDADGGEGETVRLEVNHGHPDLR